VFAELIDLSSSKIVIIVRKLDRFALNGKIAVIVAVRRIKENI
jgi:hypothetical protein